MFEKASADWPHEQKLGDGGTHIYGKYVHPMLPGRMRVLAILIVMVLAGLVLNMTESFGAVFGLIVASMLAWYAGVRDLFYRTFGKSVDVKVYPERIAVRQGARYKNYSRQEDMELRVERHEKAKLEQANAIRTGNDSFRVFRESVQVVMQYGEKRVPLAELREVDVEKAKALVLRLQNACAAQDQTMRRMSQGQTRPAEAPADFKPARPAGDFGPEPEIR